MGEKQKSLAGAPKEMEEAQKPNRKQSRYNRFQAASALYKSCRISDYEEASYWATYLTEKLGESEYYVATILTKLVSEDGAPEEWKSLFPAIQALMVCAGKFHLKNSILQAIWQLCHSRKWYMTSEGQKKAEIDESIEQEVKLDSRQLPGYAVDGIHCKGKDIDTSITGTWQGWASILRLWNEHLEKYKGLEEKELIKLWAEFHKKKNLGGREHENQKTEKERGEEENGNQQ